jgi:aspartate 1-decarboxylase
VKKRGYRVVIVVAAELDDFEANAFQPSVVVVDEMNRIIASL